MMNTATSDSYRFFVALEQIASLCCGPVLNFEIGKDINEALYDVNIRNAT